MGSGKLTSPKCSWGLGGTSICRSPASASWSPRLCWWRAPAVLVIRWAQRAELDRNLVYDATAHGLIHQQPLLPAPRVPHQSSMQGLTRLILGAFAPHSEPPSSWFSGATLWEGGDQAGPLCEAPCPAPRWHTHPSFLSAHRLVPAAKNPGPPLGAATKGVPTPTITRVPVMQVRAAWGEGKSPQGGPWAQFLAPSASPLSCSGSPSSLPLSIRPVPGSVRDMEIARPQPPV